MTPVLFLVVSLAGGLGAVARFAIDALAARLVGRRSRWGIIAVNVTGSFALGLVSGLASRGIGDANLAAVLGVGVLGGYTTFSTAMWDSVTLLRERRWAASAAHALGALIGSAAAAWLGFALGQG